MILKAGVDEIKLPEIIQAATSKLHIFTKGNAQTNPESYAMAICQVSDQELLRARAEHEETDGLFEGFPAMYAISEGEKLLLYPAPDRDLVADFYYCPVMKCI